MPTSMTNTSVSRRTLLKGSSLFGLAAAGTVLDPSLLTPAEQALAAEPGSVKLNILYIGAHPDDEAWTLAALGQWNEFHGQKAGVITVTRGEGGENATGFEEGPELGLIRETEERKAVGYAGIEHIFNLDALDFFYTLSAPLSYDVWGGEAVLNRIVRVIRATRPDVIVTMNPSAVEGNHGNHQQAAMFAVEAYLLAGNRDVFPEHMSEGFEPWSPSRIFRSGSNGEGGSGPGAVAAGYEPTVASDLVYGAWNGTYSKKHDARWSAVHDKSVWAYETQGWAVRPPTTDVEADIPVTWFTLLESRTPLADPKSGDGAALGGATVSIEGGLALGITLDVSVEAFHVLPGEPFDVSVTLSSPKKATPGARADIDAPDGWTIDGPVSFPTIRPDGAETVKVRVTPPAGAEPGEHVLLKAKVTTKNRGSGWNVVPVRVAGQVEASFTPRSEIAQFLTWTEELGVQHLDALVPTRVTLGSGLSKRYDVEIRNFSAQAHSGEVEIELPDGVVADPAHLEFSTLAGGDTTVMPVTLVNEDASMPTANRAPNGGVYDVSVVASTDAGTATVANGLHLLPRHTATQGGVVKVDGQRGDGEYSDPPLDVGTLWEGDPVEPADASGSTWVNFDDEALYVHVSVVDDKQGSVLVPEDDKQRFRTDSIEIMMDPRGTSEHTGTTFILGVVPMLDDPARGNPPGYSRDHDAHQGPVDKTAPGVEVKATVAEPYAGYEIEAKIPFAVLPDGIDPERMGFNVVVYDSDTQDKTGQSRIGWSTFPGVQADPMRWGVLALPGLDPKPSAPTDPIIPNTATKSVESPLSIIQSAADGVPLAGGASLPQGALEVEGARSSGGEVRAHVTIAKDVVGGVIRAYLWDNRAKAIVDSQVIDDATSSEALALKQGSAKDATLAVSYDLKGTTAAVSVTP